MTDHEAQARRRLRQATEELRAQPAPVQEDVRATGESKGLTIRLLGLCVGDPTPYDDEFLMEYDPGRPGVDPWGRPMLAHIATTPDRSRAMVFTDFAHAHEFVSAVVPVQPTRADGQPNRPLTAFNLAFEPLET